MKKLKSNFITKTKENRLYQIPVPIIGLTGGIATGKSTVAKFLKEQPFPILDADQLVKSVYRRPEVINFIKVNFSSAIEGENINFKTLREVAFNNKENIAIIEAQIYQHLPDEFLNAYKKLSNPNFVIYDVPLLFEKGLDKLVDLKICVYAPRKTQIDRIISRDHITAEQAVTILDYQMDIEEKRNKADFQITNTESVNQLEKSINELINQLFE